MDYVRTARAKGLREKTVIYKHAFRNALIPITGYVVGSIVAIFGGSIIIETLFSWKGVGKLLIDSLNQQDYTVALAMQMFYILLALAANLITDLCYCLVDPRIKLE
ncbi:ABC transporter permease [Sellimonas intestinalis]